VQHFTRQIARKSKNLERDLTRHNEIMLQEKEIAVETLPRIG